MELERSGSILTQWIGSWPKDHQSPPLAVCDTSAQSEDNNPEMSENDCGKLLLWFT